jgi:hypothetical protein
MQKHSKIWLDNMRVFLDEAGHSREYIDTYMAKYEAELQQDQRWEKVWAYVGPTHNEQEPGMWDIVVEVEYAGGLFQFFRMIPEAEAEFAYLHLDRGVKCMDEWLDEDDAEGNDGWEG